MQVEEAKTLGALEAKIGDLTTKVDQMHGRVFNGMAKEILKVVDDKVKEIKTDVGNEIREIKKQMGVWQKVLVGLLISMLIGLALIIFQTRSDSEKNYKAIIDIGTALSNHIDKTVPKVDK